MSIVKLSYHILLPPIDKEKSKILYREFFPYTRNRSRLVYKCLNQIEMLTIIYIARKHWFKTKSFNLI